MKYLTCPKCGMKYHIKAQTCPKCKITPEQYAHEQEVAKKKRDAAAAKKKAKQERAASKKKTTLRACYDCGHMISRQAKLCPNCGARVPKQVSRTTATGVILIMVLFFAGVIAANNKQTTSQATNRQSQKNISPVENSAWDGSIRQVKTWFEYNLRDPDSVQVITWGQVQHIDIPEVAHKYYAAVKYRAKNGFGGYVVDTRWFYFDGQGRIIKTRSSKD